MRPRLHAIRTKVLQSTFALLYSHLSNLHEPVGRIVFGAAWHHRRQLVMPPERHGTLLDLGCGEGRLLEALTGGPFTVIGVEPSAAMARKARRRQTNIIRASAQALPLQGGTIDHVVSTYPGPWIINPETWGELTRVTAPGATIRILLGGDVVRGRGAVIRRRLLRLAYGNPPMPGDMPSLGHSEVHGGYTFVEDEWGTAIIWSGVRATVEVEMPRRSTESGC